MDTQNNTQMEVLDRYIDERIKQAITADRAAQAEAQEQKAKEAHVGILDRYIEERRIKEEEAARKHEALRKMYGLDKD